MSDLLQLPPSEIEALITHYRESYYNGIPEISDAEFDALVDRLTDICPDSEVLTHVGAPGMGTKGRHRIPMGSLEKATVFEIENAWRDHNPILLVQDKLDGISIALEYDAGRLVAAVTRGDGIEGEVVTHNAIWQNVKPQLPYGFTGALRGEIILPKSVFKTHFANKGFANPRNTVSGTVRRKDDPEKLNAHFCVRYFDAVDYSDSGRFRTETEMMQFLVYEFELETVEACYGVTLSHLETVFAQNATRRDGLDYEVDGVVVKIDDHGLQRMLGALHNRPRWAYALKFANQGAWTVLNGIDWQLGVGGRLTPVARLNPVQVGGVMVSNATLHHYEYAHALGAQPGDQVFVERAGDVIPHVTQARQRGDVLRGRVTPPGQCPSCGDAPRLHGKFYICHNMACPGKVYGAVYKWVKETEIDEIGDVWIKVFTESGLVKSPADLYRLTIDQLLKLPRMGEVLAQKILSNIHKRREVSLANYLAGLNIQGFSRTRAQTLINSGLVDIADFLGAEKDRIKKVPGLGDTLAHIIYQGLREKAALVVDLGKAGVRHLPVDAKPAEGPLAGKVFCFTGAIQRMNSATKQRWTRPQMEGLVKQRGGTVRSSVTRDVTFLVMVDPNSTSTKAKAARQQSVTILSEDAFFDLVGAK